MVHRATLVVGNRDVGQFVVLFDGAAHVGDVDANVHRGQAANFGMAAQKGQMYVVEVKVPDIELVSAPHDVFHRLQMAAQRFSSAFREGYGLAAERLEFGAYGRVAAGEHRHVVAQVDQLVGQAADHSLDSAVANGRHGHMNRHNLSNLHRFLLYAEQASAPIY